MVQPASAWMTCSICNASYDSETKLRDHRRMAHRDAGLEAARAHNHQTLDITFGRQNDKTMDEIFARLKNARV